MSEMQVEEVDSQIFVDTMNEFILFWRCMITFLRSFPIIYGIHYVGCMSNHVLGFKRRVDYFLRFSDQNLHPLSRRLPL